MSDIKINEELLNRFISCTINKLNEQSIQGGLKQLTTTTQRFNKTQDKIKNLCSSIPEGPLRDQCFYDKLYSMQSEQVDPRRASDTIAQLYAAKPKKSPKTEEEEENKLPKRNIRIVDHVIQFMKEQSSLPTTGIDDFGGSWNAMDPRFPEPVSPSGGSRSKSLFNKLKDLYTNSYDEVQTALLGAGMTPAWGNFADAAAFAHAAIGGKWGDAGQQYWQQYLSLDRL